MEGVNNNDAATLSLLSGGYGYGFGGNRGGFEFDGSVVNNNVERNGLDTHRENQFTRDAIREQGIDSKLLALQVQAQGNAAVAARDNADARAEAAKCCCEAKILTISENNATRTLLLEQRIAQQDNNANSAGQAAILSALNGIAASLAGGRGNGNG